jgi:hypothetical protein
VQEEPSEEAMADMFADLYHSPTSRLAEVMSCLVPTSMVCHALFRPERAASNVASVYARQGKENMGSMHPVQVIAVTGSKVASARLTCQ